MKKILLIDDDALVARIYRAKFANEGFEVMVASDGVTARRMLKESRPVVVILDLQLPDVQGVELLAQIRAQPEFKDLPVIVFSGTYLSTAIQAAWKAGATKCLSKANCTPSQLVSIIKGVAQGSAPTPAAPAVRPAPATVEAVDPGLTADIRAEFVGGLPALLADLRQKVQLLNRSEAESLRLKCLEEIYREMHALTGDAYVCGLVQVAQLSEALEALLREVYEKPRHFTPSTLRTIATATDFLGVLFTQGNLPDDISNLPLNILVVDDEPLSRRAITYALEKAKLKAVNVDNPPVALQLLTDNPFDLVFLDVDMPGMTGFELCARLRALPRHRKTPVVFVTALNDFESRAQSTIAGGNDLIAKPFLFIELAVKAMVYVLRSRIEAANRKAAEQEKPGA